MILIVLKNAPEQNNILTKKKERILTDSPSLLGSYDAGRCLGMVGP
jgi:hypothetical protein